MIQQIQIFHFTRNCCSFSKRFNSNKRLLFKKKKQLYIDMTNKNKNQNQNWHTSTLVWASPIFGIYFLASLGAPASIQTSANGSYPIGDFFSLQQTKQKKNLKFHLKKYCSEKYLAIWANNPQSRAAAAADTRTCQKRLSGTLNSCLMTNVF